MMVISFPAAETPTHTSALTTHAVQAAATWGKPAGSQGRWLAPGHQVQQVEGRHHCDIFTNKTRGKEQGQELSGRKTKEKKNKLKHHKCWTHSSRSWWSWFDLELNTYTHGTNTFQMPIFFQAVSLLSPQAYLYRMNKIHTIFMW